MHAVATLCRDELLPPSDIMDVLYGTSMNTQTHMRARSHTRKLARCAHTHIHSHRDTHSPTHIPQTT